MGPLSSFDHILSSLGEMFGSFVHGCAGLSGSTLVIALIVAALAIVAGIKQGFRSKPLSATPPKGGPGKWAWIAVAVLWVVVMLNYFDRQLLAVLNSSITGGENGIQMTQAQFGLVTSAFLIVYAALSPVGGYLADRFSRKFIILCSLVVWSVVTWMTGKAESYEELIFWRGAMGVSEAFYIPAALALISDYHRGSTRSMATGLHMSGIYAGQMLAGCGALMAGAPYNLGWRLTFETFGFIGVAYALIVIFFLHDPQAPTAESATPASEEQNIPGTLSDVTHDISATKDESEMQQYDGARVVDYRIRFSGRVKRITYWMSSLLLVAVAVVLEAIIGLLGYGVEKYPMLSYFMSICAVVLCIYVGLAILIGMGLFVRRMHDIGINSIIALVLYACGVVLSVPYVIQQLSPIVSIIYGVCILCLLCKDSQKSYNKWGSLPKFGVQKDGSISQAMLSLFTGRAMAMLLIMYAFAGFANWFLMGWYPRLLQDMFGLTEAEAGPKATLWVNIAKYAAVLLAAVVADMWYRKNRNARAYVPGICFCLAGPCVIIAMLPALGVPVALGLGVTLALVSMQGVAQGSLDATLMPVLRSLIDERFSATGYGLLNLTSVSAGAIISVLGGYLKDSGVPLGVPLGIAGFLMVICGLFFFFLPKKDA